MTRVCTKMCFRNGSKSRISVPLWLGVVAGVDPRGVCEAGAQGMCFRNGSISRNSLPLWLGLVAGVGPRGVCEAGGCCLRLTGLFALLTIVLTVMAMVAMSTWYARQRAKSTAIRKIMGCPRLEIYTHTLASFLSASLIAAVIAIPVIYIYTGRWLQTYSYRIDNHWWMYPLALLIVGVVATLSISYRAVQLMNTNPALALRKD